MQEKTTMKKRMRMLWIIPPIAIGIGTLMMLTSNKPIPTKVEYIEKAQAVRTLTVPQLDLQPEAEGYGVVQPAKVWGAIAQVSGRVVEMHPRLRGGEIIPVGDLLYRIDPVNYELAQEQLKAELAELEVRQLNTIDLLDIEQRSLELAQREATRLKKLALKGDLSRSSADSAERTMLNSRTAVQNLTNTLALIPSQRRVIEVKLAQAKRDLDNTRIHAPFNLRIANLSMEMDQYITSGQKLFEGDGVDRSEVVAQVALSSMRNLFLGHQETPPSKQELTEGLAKYADLKATILMDIGDTAGRPAQWEAEFVRFTDNIDSETRTIGVVVALDKPFEKIIPGQRPPLSKGMFVKVLLQGRIQPQQIVVPRSALRNGKVYLLDEQQRLLIHQVEVRYSQNGLSVIQSGIEAGQQLVLSDLVPAIAGMRLQPQVDIRMEQQLVRSTGKSRPGSAR